MWEKAMRVVWLLLVLVSVVLMSPARAFAQAEPHGEPMGPMMCYYGPGQYLPCGSAPPPSGPDPFQWSRARFESVRARVRAVGLVKGEEGQPLPQTPEELSRQTDSLFVFAAFKLDTLAFDSEGLVKQTEGTEAALPALDARERELKARAEAMPAALHDASEKLNVEAAKAEAKEQAIAAVESLTDRMHARADRAALESLQWLTVASPPGTLLVNEGMVSGRKTAWREPLSEPVEIANGLVRDSGYVHITPTFPPGLRAAPRGTVDEKIAAIETLIDRFGVVKWEYEQRVQRYKEAAAAWERKATRVKSLEAVVGSDERRLEAVADLYRKAQQRTSDAEFNGYRAGANAARAIAEAYTLEKFRDRVVIPEVKRFLRVNGITRNVDRNVIVQLYEMRKSALPSGRDWVALNRLVEVEKRALEILPDFMAYITAAAESLATPGDAGAADLKREIEAGTAEAGRDLVEKAADADGPLYKIARAIWGKP